VSTNSATLLTGTTAQLNGDGEPGRRRDDRLVPLRHREPGHLQRHLRDARADRRRLALGAGNTSVAFSKGSRV
jgi:hypothetical protein